MNFNKLVFKVSRLIWVFGRSEFYRDMADAYRRKVALRDFFDREFTNAKLVNDSIKMSVLKEIRNRHSSGHVTKISELMLGIAPLSDQILLSAVDDAGNKNSEALEKAADAIDFQIRSLKVLGKNLVMPAIAVPLVGVMCVMTSQIIMSISDSAPPEIWVGFNGSVKALAEFIDKNIFEMAVGFVVAVASFIYSLPRWTGQNRLKFEEFPGFSLYRDYNTAIFLNSMAMMIGSGKTLRQVIDTLSPSSSKWMRWHLQRIVASLEDNPTDYIAAFSRGLMPKKVRARMASLLESSKSFDEVLTVIGTKELGRIEKSVELSAKALNFSLTGILVSIAMVLSIGLMTIPSALSAALDPAKLMMKNGK